MPWKEVSPMEQKIGVENYVVFPAQTCRSLAMESPQGA